MIVVCNLKTLIFILLIALNAYLAICCADPNCQQCNFNIQICQRCNSLFNLYSNGRCCSITLASQCSDCNPTGNTCTACLSGYYLEGASCFACSYVDPRCLLCNSKSNCNKCQNGYFPNGFQCLACQTPFCADCTPGGAICNTCLTDYWLNKYQRCCQTHLGAHCQDCSTTGDQCVQCSVGYRVLNSGSCCSTNLDSKCFNCNIQGNLCTSCLSGFKLYANGRCCYTNLDTHCSDCSPDGNICTFCEAGYFINTTLCLPCNRLLPHCATCSSDGINCISCQNSYRLFNNGRCCSINLDPRCINCGFNADICNTCQNGYTLYTNGRCCETKLHQKCIDCTPDGSECTSCQKGYFLTTLTCQQCRINLPNCIDCASVSVCRQCVAPYLPSDDKSKCLSCNSWISNCISCKRNQTNQIVCSGCVKGYYLGKKGSCVDCWSSISFCIDCISDIDGVSCNSCYGDYLVSEDGKDCLLCGDIISNCKNCSNISKGSIPRCLVCMDGYIPNSNMSGCIKDQGVNIGMIIGIVIGVIVVIAICTYYWNQVFLDIKRLQKKGSRKLY